MQAQSILIAADTRSAVGSLIRSPRFDLLDLESPQLVRGRWQATPAGEIAQDFRGDDMSRFGCTIFVGNLPGDVREREVEDLFYKVCNDQPPSLAFSIEGL